MSHLSSKNNFQLALLQFGLVFTLTILLTANKAFSQYCSPTINNCGTGRKDSVSIGNLNNTSSCSANGYGDYTTTVAPATAVAGKYIAISVKVTSSTIGNTVAWIDLNQNNRCQQKP